MEFVSGNEDWRIAKETLKDRQRHLLNNEFASDITLSLQNGDRIFAHKVFLATSSPVFASIFYGPLSSKEEVLEIPDCDDKISFLEFLKHFYCDECELDWDNIFVVLYLANQYLVPSLTSKCVDFLGKGLNVENALIVLEHANRFGENELVKNCLQFIYARAATVFKSEMFIQLELETVSILLKQVKLNIREIDFFKAVDLWCNYQLEKGGEIEQDKKEKRKILGDDAVQLFRFPAIDANDFRKYCVPSGILTPEECCDVFLFLTITEQNPSQNRNELAEQLISPHKFSLTERSGSRRILNREVSVEQLSHVSSESESKNGIRFEVDKPIKLLGVTLLGNPSKNNILDFYIKMKGEKGEDSPYKVIAQPRVSVISDNHYDVYSSSSQEYNPPPNSFKVLFENAVNIDAGKQYSVHARTNGHVSFKGTYEKMLHLSEDGIIFKFYKVAYHYNGTCQGQFPEFLYQQI